MSKSDPSDYSRINLTDDADRSRRKSARRRPIRSRYPPRSTVWQAGPEADNLVGIYAALTGGTKTDVLTSSGVANFSTFKSALVDLAVAKLGADRRRDARLQADHAYIDCVLRDGADRARERAAVT